uniref:Uncharacterized protein n=1 Tax=Peronospora matthiolae TaxID=2874970 RepID=A0AAV1TLP3_9STRA
MEHPTTQTAAVRARPSAPSDVCFQISQIASFQKELK